MARVHYAKEVLEWLSHTGINYLTWEENPPKVPQARPIEKFWNICRQKYRMRKTEAKKHQLFRENLEKYFVQSIRI